MRWFSAIKNFFVGIFYKQSSQEEETVVDLPQQTIEAPTPTPVVDWLDWCGRAMLLSGSFEGKGADWGNPVGNFDKAGLTCGLLGFTWRWNNQPPMILEFIKRHGEPKLFELMPKTAHEYAAAAREGEHKGFSTVADWSSGSRVHEPYRSELKAFWSSPEMKQIQTEKAWEMMGAWAKKKCLEGQGFFGMNQPSFVHFAFWFDQAVLNGQGKSPLYLKPSNTQVLEAMYWYTNESGYNEGDRNKNVKIWKDLLSITPIDQLALLYMAYKRADVALDIFDLTTMNRRGTIAMGVGWVNGSLREYSWKPNIKS